ncbi:MAG: dephospho-CoA kinase [Dysgonamonadaceae bacterium]|jgi:dephospho-CoA kinase|nr:dephospho-CoA kinase [Dysgonamonadaceae bacterium]
MLIVGLTGGIGSGKSVVAGLFETLGFPVYDSDREAKRITATSPVIRNRLSERFGPEIYSENTLNKILLSSLLFGNEKNLKFANSVIHPEVMKDFLQWTEQHQGCRLTIVESAILFESGFDKRVDIKISVSAPLELRIERVQRRDGATKEAVLARISNQMAEEERNGKSDYIIINDNCRAILPQVEKILNELAC